MAIPTYSPYWVPRPGKGPAMKGDCPGGVLFENVIVSVPVVLRPWAVSFKETFSVRYWSSLFPPRLMMSAISDDGWSCPATPAPAQAAWVRVSADHSSTWRPSAAEERASAMACSLKGRSSRACRVAEASVASSSVRADESEV